MIKASFLRDSEVLKKIPSVPGYYKWWASKSELEVILEKIKVQFSSIESSLEKENDLFCIYVGIAVNESVRSRLNWHVNDAHTVSRVMNGTLSTLRQSIASIVAGDQFDKEATDLFIDKLYVEWFCSDNEMKSYAAKLELHDTEKRLLTDFLRILNIQDNKHPLALDIKAELKKMRKESRQK